MPEFILPHGSAQAEQRFGELDAFTQGYIEAAFFTDASDLDDGDLAGATTAEIAPESLAKIAADCERFQRENTTALRAAYNAGRQYDEQRAGNDFWYTRNHHGVGYWDRDELPKHVQDALTAAAHKWREVDLYRGDDGQVYFS